MNLVSKPKTMILNLDNFQINGITLGKKTEFSEGNNQQGCISFYVKHGVVNIINIRLNEFYSKGEVFSGKLLINDELVDLDDSIQPETIRALLDDQIDHWDDAVEVNYQYKRETALLEFSWHWRNDKLIANYAGLEIQ